MKKKLLTVLLSGAIFCSGLQASASSKFFADVPADDWSYSAVNELISTGKVPGYTERIPDGRIMSRLEMAMIVEEAQRNLSAFNAEDQAVIEKLGKEYFYDVMIPCNLRHITKLMTTGRQRSTWAIAIL